MGFGGNPENAYQALYSAEEAIKKLSFVDETSILHLSEISVAHAAFKDADNVVR